MPAHYLSEFVGGWDRAAFIMDLDGHFRISRLHDVLLDRLQALLPSKSVIPVVERCLGRVHIFRPTSSEQLSATLAYLPQYHAKNVQGMDLGMLAVHSIDSFYWLDRFRAEQLYSTSPLSIVSRNIFSILESLRSCHGFITILIHSGFVQPFQSNSTDQRATNHPVNTPDAYNQAGTFFAPQIFLAPLLSDIGYQSTARQWVAQLDGNPQSCIITSQIRDKGITMD
ncbi:hypothetical protein CPB84DRAFT_1759460 [Gymnopilus junonius]|uniref:Uncharacterized protein n=1 Tax=Gymnopilus junonius TaxID=109634 RepID=A0A9P5P0J2_GYMJU|nr:hypothetical protein CPB84DRAFT_1759460 [Gymnopilus junonius]